MLLQYILSLKREKERMKNNLRFLRECFMALTIKKFVRLTVADPGFPVGGAPSRWGGANL